jgi:hypothetical protein
MNGEKVKFLILGMILITSTSVLGDCSNLDGTYLCANDSVLKLDYHKGMNTNSMEMLFLGKGSSLQGLSIHVLDGKERDGITSICKSKNSMVVNMKVELPTGGKVEVIADVQLKANKLFRKSTRGKEIILDDTCKKL